MTLNPTSARTVDVRLEEMTSMAAAITEDASSIQKHSAAISSLSTSTSTQVAQEGNEADNKTLAMYAKSLKALDTGASTIRRPHSESHLCSSTTSDSPKCACVGVQEKNKAQATYPGTTNPVNATTEKKQQGPIYSMVNYHDGVRAKRSSSLDSYRLVLDPLDRKSDSMDSPPTRSSSLRPVVTGASTSHRPNSAEKACSPTTSATSKNSFLPVTPICVQDRALVTYTPTIRPYNRESLNIATGKSQQGHIESMRNPCDDVYGKRSSPLMSYRSMVGRNPDTLSDPQEVASLRVAVIRASNSYRPHYRTPPMTVQSKNGSVQVVPDPLEGGHKTPTTPFDRLPPRNRETLNAGTENSQQISISKKQDSSEESDGKHIASLVSHRSLVGRKADMARQPQSGVSSSASGIVASGAFSSYRQHDENQRSSPLTITSSMMNACGPVSAAPRHEPNKILSSYHPRSQPHNVAPFDEGRENFRQGHLNTSWNPCNNMDGKRSSSLVSYRSLSSNADKATSPQSHVASSAVSVKGASHSCRPHYEGQVYTPTTNGTSKNLFIQVAPNGTEQRNNNPTTYTETSQRYNREPLNRATHQGHLIRRRNSFDDMDGTRGSPIASHRSLIGPVNGKPDSVESLRTGNMSSRAPSICRLPYDGQNFDPRAIASSKSSCIPVLPACTMDNNKAPSTYTPRPVPYSREPLDTTMKYFQQGVPNEKQISFGAVAYARTPSSLPSQLLVGTPKPTEFPLANDTRPTNGKGPLLSDFRVIREIGSARIDAPEENNKRMRARPKERPRASSEAKDDDDIHVSLFDFFLEAFMECTYFCRLLGHHIAEDENEIVKLITGRCIWQDD